ncbi:MAG TPA: threonine synthase [Ktedonobacter sp.]|nr:threonine synthase [Ktedonobacter sp.]HBE24211.1 threonine synthase [Ktedonobacter sp.]
MTPADHTNHTSHIHHLQCVLCGTNYTPADVLYCCPSCGPLGVLAVHYDYEQITPHISRAQLAADHNPTLWRYRALLPISYSHLDVPPLAIGGTPLYPVKRLRDYLGMSKLWLKDDTRNPSASLKDRASIIAVVLAQGNTVACASTGNAASSLAVQAASLGLPCYIFVPQNAPRAKIIQLLMCGATVFSVDGSYDDAFDLCIEACNTFGWYNRNTGYNPYLVEGKKTVGLEIAEQLGWQAPDTILVPTGDGCIISGVYRGFEDLYRLGMIERLPRLIAVQAEGSPAIVRALESDGVVRPYPANTVADGISVGLPRNGAMAVRHIRASNGFGITVSDAEILLAEKNLAMHTGVFAEPSGAASYAGLLRLLDHGRIARDERVVLLVTGSGLKSIDAVVHTAGSVIPIAKGPEGMNIVSKNIALLAPPIQNEKF